MEKLCAEPPINAKCLGCRAATVCTACIGIMHDCDAHKDIFIYLFNADTFALFTAGGGRPRAAWKAGQERNRIPRRTWLSREFIGTGNGFSVMLLAVSSGSFSRLGTHV